jgi:sodium-dependent phosphate cotransporter
MGHITRREELQRAFAAATVHDFFNLFTVIFLFPLEVTTHVLERSATFLANTFAGMGGMTLVSPLKYSVEPVVRLIQQSVQSPVVMLIISLVMLFVALTFLVRIIKSLIMTKAEVLLDRFLFKTAAISFMLGLAFTAIIQSSSVTTSLIVPLVGAGLLTVSRIYPYALGANIGTTVTCIMASFVTGNLAAVTLAFSHLLFNILGVAIMYFVLRPIPIWLSKRLGAVVAHRRWLAFVYVLVAFFVIPLLLIFLMR